MHKTELQIDSHPKGLPNDPTKQDLKLGTGKEGKN